MYILSFAATFIGRRVMAGLAAEPILHRELDLGVSRHRAGCFRGSRPSLRLETKGLDQLLHVLDLVSHKPAHLLRRAAGDNVAVFGQLRDQLWSMGRLHEFPI